MFRIFRKKFSLILTLLLMVFVSLMYSCGSDNSSLPPSTGSSGIDITGTWEGTWASSNQIDDGSLTASFTQSGTSFEGTISITNSPCISTGSVSGSISGNDISFGVVAGTDKTLFTATVTSNSMSGKYVVTSGYCSGDTGIFSVLKK